MSAFSRQHASHARSYILVPPLMVRCSNWCILGPSAPNRWDGNPLASSNAEQTTDGNELKGRLVKERRVVCSAHHYSSSSALAAAACARFPAVSTWQHAPWSVLSFFPHNVANKSCALMKVFRYWGRRSGEAAIQNQLFSTQKGVLKCNCTCLKNSQISSEMFLWL